MPGPSALDSPALIGHPACGRELAGFGDTKKATFKIAPPRRGIGITEEEAHETS
jgi:hypothetical protein